MKFWYPSSIFKIQNKDVIVGGNQLYHVPMNVHTSTCKMNVSFAPLSPTVDMVFVIVGYLYILDLPGLSNNSNINYRGEENKTLSIKMRERDEKRMRIRWEEGRGTANKEVERRRIKEEQWLKAEYKVIRIDWLIEGEGNHKIIITIIIESKKNVRVMQPMQVKE